MKLVSLHSTLLRTVAALSLVFAAAPLVRAAIYALLDDLTRSVKGREAHQPTFAYFQMKLCEVFPSLRNDREFLELVIDTLKVEREAYRDLHVYMAANHWGQ